jgi:hypothetical protein
MAPQSPRQVFVNLAVRDLNRSMEFFGKLGFNFNPQFTDDNAACMILNKDAYVMLLHEPFFKTFTRKQPCDAANATEALLALSCSSKEEVDEMVGTALANGGDYAMASTDLGFMYGWSFYDPDGHHWEVMWMDPAHLAEPARAT